MTYYIVGFLMAVGTLFGRYICGYACPFGLIQELLYKLPIKKLKAPKTFGVLKYGKYLTLAVLVVAVPLITFAITGAGVPAFCKYLCPAGPLEAGIPVLLLNSGLRSAAGWLFVLKLALLVVTLAACALIFRPFCRFVCPLGAVYGLFNPISVLGLRLDRDKCTGCKACARVCKMGVDPSVNPGDFECIRCGDCVRACPEGALSEGLVKVVARKA
jgi:polyferredoxin